MSKKSLFARSTPQVSSIQQLDQPSQTTFYPLISLFTRKPNPPQEYFLRRLLFILFLVTITEWLITHIIDTYALNQDNPHKLLYQGLIMSLIAASFALSWLGLIRISKDSEKSRLAVMTLASVCFFITIFLTRFLFAQRAFLTNSASDWCSLCFNLINIIANMILADLIFSQWYLKLVPPLGNLFALVMARILAEDDDLRLEWINIVVMLLSITVMVALKVKIMIRNSKKASEDSIWMQMYSVMLNNVPSAIAVLSKDDKITYTNSEFDKLSMKYENNLLEKIISVESMNLEIIEVVSLPRLSPKADQTESRIVLAKQFEEDNDSEQDVVKSSSSPLSISNGASKSLIETIQSVRASPCSENTFIYKGKLTNSEGIYASMPLDIKICKMQSRTDLILILSEIAPRDLLLPLENANEYKNKLLATVSHEMRTPLNGNLSLIEAAMNDPGLPFYLKDKFLVPAYRSGQLLWHLVNDVLDVAQIQARKLRLSYERLPLRTTIENCLKLVELKAQAKGVALVMDLDCEMPHHFNTDHNRLSQIILNLLSNALKFTFSGEVRVKVNVIAPSLLEFSIKDTGIGMSPEDVDKLFRHFTRINYGKRKNINTTGVGLGLSIANNLVKMLGAPGSRGINVKSVPEQGSSFSFLLHEAKPEIEEDNNGSGDHNLSGSGDAKVPDIAKPVQLPLFHIQNLGSGSPTTTQEGNTEERFDCITPANKRRPYESPSPKNIRKLTHNLNLVESRFKALLKSPYENWKRLQGGKPAKSVLVVDDEPFNVMALEAILKPFGLEVESAYNGSEALEKIMKKTESSDAGNNYQIVFMDCQMPMMTGYEAAEAVRKMLQEKGVQEIPIVGCSGFQNKEHYVRSMMSGMREVLVKPVTREKVKDVLKKYVKCELKMS